MYPSVFVHILSKTVDILPTGTMYLMQKNKYVDRKFNRDRKLKKALHDI